MNRNYYFDNLKSILIFLVVLGHFIEPLLDYKFIRFLYLLIYSFHMPLFIFASGFFSKNTSIEKILLLWKMFLKYQVLFILIAGIFSFISPSYSSYFLSDAQLEINYLTIIKSLLTPVWILWYLLALIFWKLITYKVTIKWYHILISFVFSVVIVLFPFDGYVLSLSRMFSFLPFYLLGLWMTQDRLDLFFKFSKTSVYRVFLIIFVAYILDLIFSSLNNSSFYYVSNYQELNQTIRYAIVYRIVLISISILMSVVVLSLIPRSKNRFSSIGQNTLKIYIYHAIVFWMLIALGVYNIVISPFIKIICILVLSVFISLILGGYYEKIQTKN